MDFQNFYMLAHRISCGQKDVHRMYEEIKALLDMHAAPLTIYVMQEGTDDQWWLVLVGTTHPDPGILAQIQKVLMTRDAQALEMTPATAEWFIKDYIARQIEHPSTAQARARGKRSRGRGSTRKKKERH